MIGEEFIRIIYSTGDVEDIADANDIDLDLAMERAEEWVGNIISSAVTLINEQLESVIVNNHP